MSPYKLLLCGIALWLVSLGPATAAASRIAYVSMTTTGTSLTREGAITSALISAINHVNGRVLNQQTLAISLDAGLRNSSYSHGAATNGGTATSGAATESGNAHLTANAYGKFIQAETHGAIKSYSVLSNRKNAKGIWIAKVQSVIAKFRDPQSALRRSIAIIPTSSSKSYFLIEGERTDGNHIRDLVGQSLISSLTSSRKFTILDREHNSALNRELSQTTNGQTSSDDYALLGQRLVADYVLLTKIDQFQFIDHIIHFIDSTHTIHRLTAEASVNYQLIDPVTSEIIIAGSLNKQLSAEELRQYGRLSSREDAIDALSSYIGEKIAKAVLDAIYPTLIIDATGNNVVLAEGASALRKGESYRIYKYGKEIRDPYTSENLGREQFYCCNLTITRVTPNLIYAKVTHIKGKFESIFLPGRFILGGQMQGKSKKWNQHKNEALRRKIKKENSIFNTGNNGGGGFNPN